MAILRYTLFLASGVPNFAFQGVSGIFHHFDILELSKAILWHFRVSGTVAIVGMYGKIDLMPLPEHIHNRLALQLQR